MSLLDLAQRYRVEPVASNQIPAHVPPAVAAALPSDGVLVFTVRDEHSDTAAFSAHHGFDLADCANTLVLKHSRGAEEGFAAVVTLGSRRLDVNGAVKERLLAKRLSFAKRELATELTGMAFGGITAFGLPAGMRILVDEAVMAREFIVMGAGVRESKLLLSPALLARLPLAEIAPLASEAV